MLFYKIFSSPSIVFLPLILIQACKDKEDTQMFSKLNSGTTNIDFVNEITETKETNIFTYEYVYNGGGVATGDVNNDGLVDIYLTGNTLENKLYLNRGNFQFEDITIQAGVAGRKGWKTGVSMTDVNGDGLLDIYLCYSGNGTDKQRANQLFVNQGNKRGDIPTFLDKAKDYGIDAPGTYSTQSYFFDYDLDGDLDMFLLNHATNFNSPFYSAKRLRQGKHKYFGNRLYRNDDFKFKDITEESGIYCGGLNYGLSVSVSDFNNDNYPDLYVSNDYDEQDFFYVNNRNETFSEHLEESFGHISKNTMGSDIADFNNDNLPDLVTLDMLPEDNHRQKMLKGPDNYDKYNLLIDSGYHHQQMRNMLQLNQGINEKGIPVFSEIGQLSGISNTDWSWAPLFADFDNDGFKDLFVSNGFLRDFTNLDFQKYGFEEARLKAQAEGKELYTKEGKISDADLLFETISKIPSTRIRNCLFRNNRNLQFENKATEWGVGDLTVSAGSAYADLDNDGDLDLIVNNTNEQAGIYRNNSDKFTMNHFLRVKLQGDQKNTFAIGAKIFLKTEGTDQFLEAYTIRGYQSTVDNVLHFGVGRSQKIQRLKVIWPDGRQSVLNNIRVDTTVILNQNLSEFIKDEEYFASPLFTDITQRRKIDFAHVENSFIDFKYERLLLHELSKQGPKMSVGDVNEDGLEDIFIGGAIGQAGKLFLMTEEGTFNPSISQPWEKDLECEDTGSLFFDADKDGDLDLYVVSGGSEYGLGSPQLLDRIYINDGTGTFERSAVGVLPDEYVSGSCVSAGDFDSDGDQDLFIGGWTAPGMYPIPSPSRLLRNDYDSESGTLKFSDVTKQINSSLIQPGIVTDASWSDLDKDGWPELILVGEWMPVTIYKNSKGILNNITKEAGLENSEGLWNKLLPLDFDNDGDIDFIGGNLGWNTELKASVKEPLTMLIGDFDQDGRVDPIICAYNNGKSYPIATRDDLLGQINSLKKKFVKYKDYADATINEVLDKNQLTNSKKLYIHTLASSVVKNLGNGRFEILDLPLEAQISPVQGIVTADFNNDNFVDLLLAGNLFPYRVQYGPSDAGMGIVLKGNSKGNFYPVNKAKSGLMIRGDVRDILLVKDRNKNSIIVVSKNDDVVQVLGVK